MTAPEGSTDRRGIQSAIVNVVVTFRQIDRLYDLQWNPWSRQYLVRGDDGPRVATIYRFLGIQEGTDDQGQRLSPNMRLMGGVYRGMECEWNAENQDRVFMRTFDREASKQIDGKRVYVFKAKNNQREGLVLEHELHFEKGSFQHCDPEGVPTGPKETLLALTALSCTQSQCEMHDCYFFMLAPFPLPRPRVSALRRETPARVSEPALASVLNRLSPLWDPFNTDTASPKSDKKFVPLDVSSPAGISQTFRVHLVDPVDEAILRAQLFQRINRDWVGESSRLGADPQYRVACRVRTLVQGHEDLEKLVSLGQIKRAPEGSQPLSANGLAYYLSEQEAKSRRLRAALENAGSAVLRWVGVPQKSCKLPFSLPSLGNALQISAPWPEGDTYILTDCTLKELALSPTGKISFPPKLGISSGFGNLFSGLFEDHAADQERLEQLETIGVSCISDTLGIAGAHDYLIKLLPRLTPEPSKSVAEILQEHLNDINANASKYKKARDFWSKLAAPVLRSRDKTRWVAMKRALAGPLAKGPPKTWRSLDSVSMAGDLVDLIVNIDKYWESEDRHDGWAAVHSAVSFYDSLTSMIEKYELPEIKWSRGIFKAAKFSPVAVLFDSVDCVLDIKDAFAKRNNGAVVAAAIGSTGAILGIVGTLVGGTGVGMILVLATLATKKAQSMIAAHFKDLRVFLRHTPWGDGTDDEITDWSEGKPLFSLRADATAQERALHDVLFGTFEPKITFIGEGSMKDIHMAVVFPEGYAPPTTMTWSGSFSLASSMGGSWLKMPLDGSERLAKGEAVRLEGPQRAPTSSWAEISSTLILDIYGNRKHVIKRSFKQKFWSV